MVQAQKKQSNDNQKHSKMSCLVIILSAFLITMLTNMCSPLYKWNPGYDQNVYYVVARRMVEGDVIYKDVFDHKGPILEFFHWISLILFPNSFTGMYLIYFVIAVINGYFCYKIMRMYLTEKMSVAGTVFFLVLMETRWCMPLCLAETGDSAEMLCLPAIMYGAYICVDMIRYKKENLTNVQYLIMGLCVGYIFWIKFTILGFYIGVCLYLLFVFIRRKQWSYLFKGLLTTLCGFAILSLVIVLYFVCVHAVNDLIQVYFYDNIFSYTSKNITRHLYAIMGGLACFGIPGMIAAVFAVSSIIELERPEIKFGFLTWICSFLAMTNGKYIWPYYTYILTAYCLPGIIILLHKVSHTSTKWICVTLAVISVCTVGQLYYRISGNIKVENSVEQYANTIQAVIGDSSFYAYDDPWLYPYLDKYPDEKWIFSFGLRVKEQDIEQKKIEKERKYKYLIASKYEKEHVDGYRLVKVVKADGVLDSDRYIFERIEN